MNPWGWHAVTPKQAAEEEPGRRSLPCLKDSFSLKCLTAQKSGNLWTPAAEFSLFSLSDTAHKHCQIAGRKTQLVILNCYVFILSHLPPPLNNPRSLHRDLLLLHQVALICVCLWPFPSAFQFLFWAGFTWGEDGSRVTHRNVLRLWGWSRTDVDPQQIQWLWWSFAQLHQWCISSLQSCTDTAFPKHTKHSLAGQEMSHLKAMAWHSLGSDHIYLEHKSILPIDIVCLTALTKKLKCLSYK